MFVLNCWNRLAAMKLVITTVRPRDSIVRSKEGRSGEHAQLQQWNTGTTLEQSALQLKRALCDSMYNCTLCNGIVQLYNLTLRSVPLSILIHWSNLYLKVTSNDYYYTQSDINQHVRISRTYPTPSDNPPIGFCPQNLLLPHLGMARRPMAPRSAYAPHTFAGHKCSHTYFVIIATHIIITITIIVTITTQHDHHHGCHNCNED